MSQINVYQLVANNIVEQLNKGIIPWHRPWNGVSVNDGGAINYVSRKPYSLLNQMLLPKQGEYLTFKQITDLGGKIKKGEKSSIVVFYKPFVTEKVQSDGTKKEITIPVLRYYNVFHIDQCEGIPTKINENEKPTAPTLLDMQETIINNYVSRTGLKFTNDKPSNRAYYSPIEDTVVVPMVSQYNEISEYYSTTYHELVHSTGAEKRLNRKGVTGLAAFGSETYSREELVAEIGAAMLCKVTGIEVAKTLKNSVAYIQSWARAIKNDPKMFVIASAQAEKAALFIQDIEIPQF